MALRKVIQLRSGVSGEYLRLIEFRWNRSRKEVTFWFALYKDEATAKAAESEMFPLHPMILRVVVSNEGETFDKWFSPALIKDALEQAYSLVKKTPASAGQLHPDAITPATALTDAVDA